MAQTAATLKARARSMRSNLTMMRTLPVVNQQEARNLLSEAEELAGQGKLDAAAVRLQQARRAMSA